jgi:CRISPR-associated protein Csb2
MPECLCLTIRFLQPYSHGRGEGGEPEWPPSPLRLFQALLAAAAARWNERQCLSYAVPALTWLEEQPKPVVVAAGGVASNVPCQFYVPDNTAELLVPAWKRGKVGETPKRTEKVVRPTHLAGDAVHYLYPLTAGECPHLEVLKTAARSVTHLGWGIDMVAADARVLSQEEADRLPGHRWRVVPSGGVALRAPRKGTLADLMRKHRDFLGRMSGEGFRPVPPLSCFDVVPYHAATAGAGQPPDRPLAAFEIHRTIDEQEREPGRSRFRAFHPVRKVAMAAGMARHAAADAARAMGLADDWIAEHISGHGGDKAGQATSDQRLMFLPLPSLQPFVGVGGIRRLLIVAWPGCRLLPDLRRRLNGADLTDQDTRRPLAMLSHLATSDASLTPYLGNATVWTTVTPVILPGFDDPAGLRQKYRQRVKAGLATAEEQLHLLERLDQRIRGLLWKAFEQAGWSAEALAGVTLEYRDVGWRRGLDLARNYVLSPVPYPRFHVRVTFPRPVRGPLVIGAGRYRGFGLFAAQS